MKSSHVSPILWVSTWCLNTSHPLSLGCWLSAILKSETRWELWKGVIAVMLDNPEYRFWYWLSGTWWSKQRSANCDGPILESFESVPVWHCKRIFWTLYLPSALCSLISWVFPAFHKQELLCWMLYIFLVLISDVGSWCRPLLPRVLIFCHYQTLFPSISIGLLRVHTVGDTSAIAESNSLAHQPSSATLNHPHPLPLACSSILIASLEETYLQALPQPQTSDVASSTSKSSPLIPQHKECHPMLAVLDSVNFCRVFIVAQKIRNSRFGFPPSQFNLVHPLFTHPSYTCNQQRPFTS